MKYPVSSGWLYGYTAKDGDDEVEKEEYPVIAFAFSTSADRAELAAAGGIIVLDECHLRTVFDIREELEDAGMSIVSDGVWWAPDKYPGKEYLPDG